MGINILLVKLSYVVCMFKYMIIMAAILGQVRGTVGGEAKSVPIGKYISDQNRKYIITKKRQL